MEVFFFRCAVCLRVLESKKLLCDEEERRKIEPVWTFCFYTHRTLKRQELSQPSHWVAC